MNQAKHRLEKLAFKSSHYLHRTYSSVIRKKYWLKDETGEFEFKQDRVDVDIENECKQERSKFNCYFGHFKSANAAVVAPKVFKLAKYKNVDLQSEIKVQLVARHLAKEFSRTALENEPFDLHILDIQSVEIEGVEYLVEDRLNDDENSKKTNSHFKKADQLDAKLNEFSLWTFHYTREYLIVTDLQGTKRFNAHKFKMEYFFTEPVIYSKDKRFGCTDLGIEALHLKFLELQLTVKCQIKSSNEAENQAFLIDSMSVLNELEGIKSIMKATSEPLDCLDQHAIGKFLKTTPQLRLTRKSLLGLFGSIYKFESVSNDRLTVKYDTRSNDFYVFLKSNQTNAAIPIVYLEYMNDWLASLRRDDIVKLVPTFPVLTLREFLFRARCLDKAQRNAAIWTIYFLLLRILCFLNENKTFCYFFAPENVILTEEESNRLSFDLKLMCNEHSVQTDAEYNAPELFSSIKSNIWSFGLIMYEAVHNRQPNEARNSGKSNSIQPRYDIRMPRVHDEPSLSLLSELIEPCLRWDSSKRIAVVELFERTKRSISNTQFQSLFELIF